MVVIVTKYIGKSTKNLLKRWFIEPKANTFVGVLDLERIEKILEYIEKNKEIFDGIIIVSTNTIQKYKIIKMGNEKYIKEKIIISGIELLKEK